MRIAVRLILFIAVLALGWWLWTVFFPSPAEIVRQRMATLAQTATFGTKDSAIVRAAKAQKLVNLFNTNVLIHLESGYGGYGAREISSHDDLAETAMAAFNAIHGLKTKFLDMTVSVAPDQQSATVSCTASVRLAGNQEDTVSEMRFQFKKEGNRWLITRAETVRTLS